MCENVKKVIVIVIVMVLLLTSSCDTTDETDNTSEGGVKAMKYIDVLERMVDLKGLATPAPNGERCYESSAYNKLSKYNEETGEYENWEQNWDEGYDAPRSEDGGYIIADAKGPGAIVRIWSADPREGHIKIFIDGESVPRVDMPFKDIFGSGEFPFNLEEICYDAAKGKNCFVPITYNESCKVILYDDWGMFYQVNYISFAQGTKVETFTLPLSEESEARLKSIDKILGGCKDEETIEEETITVKAGETITLLNKEGAGAITEIKIKPHVELYGSDWDALSALSIAAYWDKEAIPSVWSTLGGFFASSTGLNEYNSLPSGVSNGIMYSRWYMPYKDGALLTIDNDSDKDIDISYEVKTEKLSVSDAESKMRFHAKWNRVKDPEKGERWPDAQFLYTEGRGRYVGTSLHIYKEIGTGDPAYHPDWWWGEGDEKFFVDGESFPSWFGTGSEDYFGYAWGTWKTFERPYHSQPFTNGGMFGVGNRLNNRFHLIDSIPFEKSFDAFLEKYHRDSYANWAFTSFWYLETSGKDSYLPVSYEDRTSYYKHPYPKAALYYEGEDLVIIESTGMQKAETQDMRVFKDYKWSEDFQLLFIPEREGDYVKFRINIKEEGEYEIKARFSKARDYGIVQHYIDDMEIGEEIDLYGNVVCTSEEISLGTVRLSAGFHELTARSKGKNKVSTGHLYGLDFIRFEPI